MVKATNHIHNITNIQLEALRLFSNTVDNMTRLKGFNLPLHKQCKVGCLTADTWLCFISKNGCLNTARFHAKER